MYFVQREIVNWGGDPTKVRLRDEMRLMDGCADAGTSRSRSWVIVLVPCRSGCIRSTPRQSCSEQVRLVLYVHHVPLTDSNVSTYSFHALWRTHFVRRHLIPLTALLS